MARRNCEEGRESLNAITDFLYGVLTWINGIVNNYGIAIIVFTILIRVVCLPFDLKSRKGMRKMALIQPKLNELQKKYANDKEKLQRKQSELMRKEGYNPLSGCLPMLLTWPLMIAMFAAMRAIANEQSAMQLFKYLIPGETVFTSADKFLWVKNIWATDSPFNPAVPVLGSAAVSVLDMNAWAKALVGLGSDEKILTVIQALNLDLSQIISADTMQNLGITAEMSAAQIASALQGANISLSSLINADTLKAAGFSESVLKSVLNPNGVNIMTVAKDSLTAYEQDIMPVAGWHDINLLLVHLALYVRYNGLLIFPVLAGVTQILSTKFNPQLQEQATGQPNGQQNGMGNFMKYFFPILSIYFCLTSNAGFAVYWVTSTCIMWVQSVLITKYLESKDQKQADTVTGEGSVK